MTTKKWRIRDVENDTLINQLRSTLKIDTITAKLLLLRGISTEEDAKRFFKPSLADLHDPFLMQGMQQAVDLCTLAFSEDWNIRLYGDYDVDGTTAVAMMHKAFQDKAKSLSYYIPDRYTEGYGLSDLGVQTAIEDGVQLMILLDCGIKSVEKISRLEEAGIRVIVCDHHTPGEIIPPCCVLDPKQKDCNYPYKELSGCGVGFKLLHALVSKEILEEKAVFELLDLLAISIGADIVDVMGENRILAYFGLDLLNTNPRSAFRMMITQAGRAFPLSLSDVVFTIAPRINAAGRLRSGRFAVEMMIHPDEEEIERLVAEIELDNRQRRELDASITEEALALVEKDYRENARSSVLHGDHWHKGVVGIVASRLIEHHYRPTIVLSGDGEKLTGSARSIPGINIYDMIAACEDLLIQFGGHAFAAGLTLERSKLDAFRDRLEAEIHKNSEHEFFTEAIDVECELPFNELFDLHENRLALPKFKRNIDLFEPFGPGNMKPVFLAKNLYTTEARILKEEHLKLKVTQPPHDLIMDAIGFRMADAMDLVAAGLPFDMLFTLESNTWQNRTTLQLMIRDIRESS